MMKLKYILKSKSSLGRAFSTGMLWSLLLVSNLIVAQNQNSIVSQQMAMQQDSKTEMNAFITESKSQLKSKPKLAHDNIQKALKISLSINDILGQARCYTVLGMINQNSNNTKKALKYYNDAHILFQGFENQAFYIHVISGLAEILESKNKYNQSLAYYKEWEELGIKRNLEDQVIAAKNGQARCNLELNNYQETENQYQQVFQMEQNRGNSIGYIQAADNLGNYYEEVDDSAQAFTYFDSSYNEAVNTNNSDAINGYYNNANNYYSNRNSVDQQIEFNEQALISNSIVNNPEGVQNASLELGKLNLKKNNPEKAITYLNQSIQFSNQSGKLEQTGQALQAITEAYKEQGDYEKALFAYQELVYLQDSIQKEKNKQVLLASNLTTELSEKDATIDLLLENDKLKDDKLNLLSEQKETEKSSSRMIIFGLIIFIIMLIVAALVIIRSNMAKKKANMMLELKSLRTQMNPHFIFNSLNSVNSFISKNDDRSANKYLSRFSQLMRMVLENSKHDFVSLASELKVLELYIELEHLRFTDQFEYTFIKSPDLNTEEIEIPPMLIQPYIENAVWHGLRYLDKKGMLTIEVKKTKNALKWIIEDNGIGRAKSAEIKTDNQKKQNSTGMKNIQTRLEILNKMNATNMQVHVIDLFDGTTAKGTRVEIDIPFSYNTSDIN